MIMINQSIETLFPSAARLINDNSEIICLENQVRNGQSVAIDDIKIFITTRPYFYKQVLQFVIDNGRLPS